MLDSIHHIAIICSDYRISRDFYTRVLEFEILDENWREERQSWKCDLISGNARIELFHFPEAPPRPSHPEAQGLRHLAFSVPSLSQVREKLIGKGIAVEEIRIDPYTGAAFTFLPDPDGLPIELYEVSPGPLSASPTK